MIEFEKYELIFWKDALNAFKKADTDESKETAKIALKKLTALKKEAEAEIKTLEGEII